MQHQLHQLMFTVAVDTTSWHQKNAVITLWRKCESPKRHQMSVDPFRTASSVLSILSGFV